MEAQVQLPARACYALLSMMDLALYGAGGALTREQIAGRQGLSQPYLSHVLSDLRRAGLVSSMPGRGGGYRLDRAPSQITLSAVLMAVGETYSLPDCLRAAPDSCRRQDDCPARKLWQELETAVTGALDRVSLSDRAGALLEGAVPPSWLRAMSSSSEGMPSVDLDREADGAGLVVIGPRGQVAMMNAAAEALLGWREEEARGRRPTEVLQLLDEHTREPAIVWPAAGDPEAATEAGATDGILIARDGTERSVWVSIAPFRLSEEGLGGALVRVRDSHGARVPLDHEVIAKSSLESVGQLSDDVLHRFNDLMTGIMGNLSLARMDVAPGSETAELLAEVETASQDASGLVQRLLSLPGARDPALKLGRLAPVLRAECDFVFRGSPSRCELEVQTQADLVMVDELQIVQAIRSLMANASEAMPAGGTVRLALAHEEVASPDSRHLPPGDYLVLTVSDEGSGVPERDLERIFDPHFTTKQGRSGLGLTSAYAIARSHGGTITVESDAGRGATFRLYLPLVPDEAGATPRVSAEESKRRILVMDDEPVVRKVLVRMLEQLGYEVAAVADGAEAISVYGRAMEERRSFGVVVLDLGVPRGLGGREAMVGLQELDPGVRAIIATAYSEDNLVADFAEHGFRDVILKPFRMGELGAMLARVLAEPD